MITFIEAHLSRDPVRHWGDVFEAYDVTGKECDKVASAFRRAGDIGLRQVEAAAH